MDTGCEFTVVWRWIQVGVWPLANNLHIWQVTSASYKIVLIDMLCRLYSFYSWNPGHYLWVKLFLSKTGSVTKQILRNYVTLTSYSFPYFLFLCSNGTSVQLQVEESGEMVGKLFSMLSVNVVGKNNGILQKGTIGVCLGGPVRGNIKVNYSRLHILTLKVKFFLF